MNNNRIETIAGIVTLIISIIYFIASFYLKTLVLTAIGPEFFPRIIAIIMFACSVLIIINSFKASKQAQSTSSDNNKSNGLSRKVLHTFLLLLMYIALINIVSYPIATVVYLIAQMTILAPKEKRNYKLFSIIAVITGFGAYTLFRYSFNIMLPLGLFKNLL